MKYIYGILLILISLLIILYFKLSLKPNQEYTLIQCVIEKCEPSMLMEKLPILIENSIVNPQQLINTLFKFQYISQKERKQKEGVNRDAFLLIHPSEQINVILRHPNYQEVLNIKLYKHQLLIIPILWYYNIQHNKDVRTIGLESVISKFI